jgi:hypothetical protein
MLVLSLGDAVMGAAWRKTTLEQKQGHDLVAWWQLWVAVAGILIPGLVGGIGGLFTILIRLSRIEEIVKQNAAKFDQHGQQIEKIFRILEHKENRLNRLEEKLFGRARDEVS